MCFANHVLYGKRARIAGVLVLAAVTVALAISALHVKKASDAGVPLPVVTTPPPTSATSTPAPGTGAPKSGTRLLAADGSVLIEGVPGCTAAPQLRVSTDGGKSWKTVTAPAPHLLNLALASSSTATLIGADSNCTPVVYTSTDTGSTWQAGGDVGSAWFIVSRQVHTPSGLGQACKLQAPIAVSAADIHRAAVICPFGVGWTSNGGRLWRHTVGVPVGTPEAIAMSPGGQGIVLVAGSPGCANGVLTADTTSFGERWVQGNCLSGGSRAGVALAPDGTAYAVVGKSAYVRSAGSANWTAQ